MSFGSKDKTKRFVENKPRIAIFARYSLSEQYKLAAEFKDTLTYLSRMADVLHVSLKDHEENRPCPEGIAIEELPLHVNRSSPIDILLKSLLMYASLPVVVFRLRRFHPDVVYLSEALPLYGLFLKWFCRTRVAITYGDRHLHNRLGAHWWSYPILKAAEALERFELRHVDGVFTRTLAAQDRIHQFGVALPRIGVVYDVPDPTSFYPRDERALRRQCGFGPDDIVLLYHGVMHCGKGLDMLLGWTAELYREDPCIGIIMVGSGPEIVHLKALANSLSLGQRAVFTGWLPTTKDVGAYCCAADICIAMRKGDASNDIVIPGALVHSMACRKIVMAPRLRGMSEIIRHGENGFLFTPDDGNDFKQWIRYLKQHHDQWDRISSRAYQDTIENYIVPVAAAKYSDVLIYFAKL